VRYRAKDNTFKVDGGLLAEQRKAEQERRRLKEAEQRLKTLEMLEIYREEKLRKEIEKIEEEKNLEEAELRRQSAHERRHQEYLQAQKQRLIEHSLSKQERQQQDAAKRYEEELRKKQGSARRRRELDKKKEPVQGYKHKKKVIESIINSQLTGLGLNSMELDELCKENYEAEQSS
jgi:type IV secretory pathway VirB10-like protein